MQAPHKFSPQSAKCDAKGIPYFRSDYLEEGARQMLLHYCPKVLKRPDPTPVIPIILEMQKAGKLKFVYADLGLRRDGRKILGGVNFKTNTLSLDQSLYSEDPISIAARFTAAHEIAHWVLHRWFHKNWKLNEEESVDGLTDDESTLHRLLDFSPRDRLEQQANTFAAAFVMPAVTFQDALIAAQQRAGIPKNLGLVFLSDDFGSRQDFRAIIEDLSKIYGVSKQSVQIRLKTLKLLVEQRRNPTSISDRPALDISQAIDVALRRIAE